MPPSSAVNPKRVPAHLVSDFDFHTKPSVRAVTNRPFCNQAGTMPLTHGGFVFGIEELVLAWN